jgi:predicted ABC-type ATPase
LLKKSLINFTKFKVEARKDDLLEVANRSGLVNKDFSLERLEDCIVVKNNCLEIDKIAAAKKDDYSYERIAQILADYLRKKLIAKGEKFSFETVFSHESKIEIIKKAKEEGYKVYLYFVSTEGYEINVYRVKVVRVGKNGHDVDENKIRDRYFRSMELMYEAAQHCYQAYFFDNSTNGGPHTMFAHFKMDNNGVKLWDEVDKASVPIWFRKYYSEKI